MAIISIKQYDFIVTLKIYVYMSLNYCDYRILASLRFKS